MDEFMMRQLIKNGGFAEFKCCRCSIVNTIPQCHYDNLRLATFVNSGVVLWKSVPKTSRIPLAETWIPRIIDICETRQILSCGACCSPLWKKNHFQEVKTRSHHSVESLKSVFRMVSL